MNSLNDVTPSRNASGMPSRMWGSWFRMKWKPKSRTERASASSRSLTSAFGSVSPSSPTTKGTSVVSPVRAAAMGAVVQSSYSGPTCRWQSMSPGRTYLPAASITRAAGGRSDSGPIATIVSPLMATAASKTSEAVTTWPPRTTTSITVAMSVRPADSVGGLRKARSGSLRPILSASSTGFPFCDWFQQAPVVLRLAPAEEVPALADGGHLIEVDPRHHQRVAARSRAGEHLAERVDDRAPRDQLHAVLDARLGDADDEAEVRVGARPETELVEVERQRRGGRVVANENDLCTLEREAAIALGVAAGLADRAPPPGARGGEDLLAPVARGGGVGVGEPGEAVGGLRAWEGGLSGRPPEAAG